MKKFLVIISLLSLAFAVVPTKNHVWSTGQIVTASSMNLSMASMNCALTVTGSSACSINSVRATIVTTNPNFAGTKTLYFSVADTVSGTNAKAASNYIDGWSNLVSLPMEIAGNGSGSYEYVLVNYIDVYVSSTPASYTLSIYHMGVDYGGTVITGNNRFMVNHNFVQESNLIMYSVGNPKVTTIGVNYTYSKQLPKYFY